MSNPSPSALATVKNIIYQQSFNAATVTQTQIGIIETAPWKVICIVVDQLVFTGGASPSLQLDCIFTFPDGTTLDYFNNGTHTTSSFVFVLGPTPANAHALVPEFLQFGPSIAGAPTNIAFRLTIFGLA